MRGVRFSKMGGFGENSPMLSGVGASAGKNRGFFVILKLSNSFLNLMLELQFYLISHNNNNG